MSGAERQTDRPCEDCGAVVLTGQEPVTAGAEHEPVAAGKRTVGSEWCTNLDCPSNHLRGLWRVGVNDYVCEQCGAALRTPMEQVFAHRRTHRDTGNGPS